jgi:hypothetical protein
MPDYLKRRRPATLVDTQPEQFRNPAPDPAGGGQPLTKPIIIPKQTKHLTSAVAHQKSAATSVAIRGNKDIGHQPKKDEWRRIISALLPATGPPEGGAVDEAPFLPFR